MISTEEILPRELTSRVPRRGKWTSEEERYTEKVIFDFENGTLDVPEGTTLRTFLSKILNCDPMRITKKYTGNSSIGKRTFTPLSRTPENILFIELSQQELRELRRIWISKLMLMEQWNSRKLNLMKGMFPGNNHQSFLQMGLGINHSLNSNTNSSSFGATTNSDDSGSHASNSSAEKPTTSPSATGNSNQQYRSKSTSNPSSYQYHAPSYFGNPMLAAERLANPILPSSDNQPTVENGSVHSNATRYSYKLPNTISFPTSNYPMSSFQRDYFNTNQAFQEEKLRTTLAPYVPLDSEMDYIIKWLKTLFYVLVDRTISVTDLEHSLHVGSISMPALLAIFNSDCIASHPRLQQVHYSIQLYLNQRGINLKLPVVPSLISYQGIALHNMKSLERSASDSANNEKVQVNIVDFNKMEREGSSISDQESAAGTKEDYSEDTISKNKSSSDSNLNGSDTSSQADNDGSSLSATTKNNTDNSKSATHSNDVNEQHSINENHQSADSSLMNEPLYSGTSISGTSIENFKDYENQAYSRHPVYAQNGSKHPHYHPSQQTKVNNDLHYPASFLNSVIHPINHTQYQNDLQMQHIYQQKIRAESLATMASTMGGYPPNQIEGFPFPGNHPALSSMLHASNGGSNNFENNKPIVGVSSIDSHNNHNTNLLYVPQGPSLAASYMPPELLAYYMHQYNPNWNMPIGRVPKVKRSQGCVSQGGVNAYKKPRKSKYNTIKEDDYYRSSSALSNISNDKESNNQYYNNNSQKELEILLCNQQQFVTSEDDYNNDQMNNNSNTVDMQDRNESEVINDNNDEINEMRNVFDGKNQINEEKSTKKHMKLSAAAEALLGLIQNK